MYKIGVIGDRESVWGFQAVGLSTVPCETVEEAKKALRHMTKEDYAIIYITEFFCKDMVEEIDQYKSSVLPAIIPIPGKDGSYGIGKSNVKKAVEKAVGADLLFGGE